MILFSILYVVLFVPAFDFKEVLMRFFVKHNLFHSSDALPTNLRNFSRKAVAELTAEKFRGEDVKFSCFPNATEAF